MLNKKAVVDLPGSRTRMRSVVTCNIAVRWKNEAAPIVVSVRRVVIAMSFLVVRVANLKSAY